METRMTTPGTLGLLSAMADGPLADLEPTVDHHTSTIRYPDAEEYLLDLHATDTDHDLAVIARVIDTPTAEDMIDLHATSIDVDAYPIVIATGGRRG
jgi:hypothetical protein